MLMRHYLAFTGCSSWKGRGPPLYYQETASRYEQEWVAQATVPVEKGDAGNQKQGAQKISYASWKPWVKQKQEQSQEEVDAQMKQKLKEEREKMYEDQNKQHGQQGGQRRQGGQI